MNRRQFLATALAAPLTARLLSALAAESAAVPEPAPPEWRRFEITTRVTLPDAAGPARLWLPLVQAAGGYEAPYAILWDGHGSGQTERVYDARYGAPNNSATEIELPVGDESTHQPEFPFLMSPCAVTLEGECPCLEPAKFRYEITAREVTV